MSLLVTICEADFNRVFGENPGGIPARNVGQPSARLELGYRADEQPIAINLA